MTEEWDQERADFRSFESVRLIALDVLDFADDDDPVVWYAYAAQHHLTVNEVVYYLNAYEAGGDAGLQAILNPDIIPPEVARRTTKTIAKTLDQHFGGRLRYRVTDEGTAVGLYEIQQRMDGEEYLFPTCQLRLTLTTNQWHLYWMRKFNAWWPYPLPKAGHRYTLKARLQQVLEDEDGCFWG